MFCQAGADGTLAPSSGRWLNSGMGSHTESLTLNTSEWPKDAAVCSLSDILETGDLPRRFFFERESLSGNPAPRREAGQAVAALTANGVGTCGADDNQGQAGHLIAPPTIYQDSEYGIGEYPIAGS